MTKYFVNLEGNYLGGFDGAAPPANAIEVAEPPPLHANQVWNGLTWSFWEGPPPAPATPRQQRVSQMLNIPRSDWTVAQQRELLELLAIAISTEGRNL